MTPTEMHIDALIEKIEELQAENARYIERLEELTSELSKLKVQADRHREALFYISEASWKDYPRLSDALDGDYLGDHYSEIATEALKGIE